MRRANGHCLEGTHHGAPPKGAEGNVEAVQADVVVQLQVCLCTKSDQMTVMTTKNGSM